MEKSQVYNHHLQIELEVKSNTEKEKKRKSANNHLGNGKKTRKRGEKYIKNNTSRNSVRSRRRRGIKNAMALLNWTTGDRCHVEFYSSHDKKVTQFSTSKELMETKLANNSTWHQSVQSPTNLLPMMSTHPIQQLTQITEQQRSPQAASYKPSEPRHSTTPKSQKNFTQMLECDDLELDQLLQEMTTTTTKSI